MEEYTNQTLSEIIKRVEQKVDDGFKNLSKKHDDSITPIKNTIYGNGKKGLVEEVQGLKAWKIGITMVLTFLGTVILPVCFIVIKEWISKIFA